MNSLKTPIEFSINLNKAEKISDTLSKARAHIFYLGANRNGGYISKDFAEKLIETLPYTPIKGIYEEEKEDFSNHGKERSLGRIYGVVPQDYNFAWEKHEDTDGVEREYASADVYLFTALYEEADDIVGKGQSMELYPPSVTGVWETVNGVTLYKYHSASFLGLQVLGDDVKPAFEGSSFFSLADIESQKWYTLFMDLSEKIDKLTIRRTGMDKYNPLFSLSDREKENKLFEALNPENIRYWIVDTYDNHLIAYDMEEDGYVKIGYEKDSETETVTLAEEKIVVFAEYVTESERDALKALRAITEATTFSEMQEKFETNIENVSNIESTLSDKEKEIMTLNTEQETAQNTITGLKEELATYVEFKEKIELEEKTAVIEKYSSKLSEEVIANFTKEIANYSLIDLKKDLAYELVQTDLSIFSTQPDPIDSGFVPKPKEPGSGIEALLDKYKK